jgi:hypothetical protein
VELVQKLTLLRNATRSVRLVLPVDLRLAATDENAHARERADDVLVADAVDVANGALPDSGPLGAELAAAIILVVEVLLVFIHLLQAVCLRHKDVDGRSSVCHGHFRLAGFRF